MKFASTLILSLAITGCTVYRSPERKDFESASPGFQVQNLRQVSCSETTIRHQAQASRLVNISDGSYLWEHVIAEKSFFESDNLQGVFCAFEKR